MREITINQNDAGQRLDKFLTKYLVNMPQSMLYKSLRKNCVRVNGKHIKDGKYMLQNGDVLKLFFKDEFYESKSSFKAGNSDIDVVYEDENILLADKKQGLLVHPDKNEYNDTLIGRIQHYLYDKGEYSPDDENSFRPSLANRIDRNTGGIVIAAKNAEALRILCEKIKAREIEKKYLAVVHGVPEKRSAVLEGYLEKNEAENRVFLKKHKTESALTVKTKYRTIETRNGLSLLEVELLTGRMHQIRAHMASIGHPLLGDGKYGKTNADKKIGFNRQALYSYSVRFDFSSDAGILNYLNGKRFTVKEVWFAEKLFGAGYRSLLD